MSILKMCSFKKKNYLSNYPVQGEPLDRNALGQLTQLHLSTSLECDFYWVSFSTQWI